MRSDFQSVYFRLYSMSYILRKFMLEGLGSFMISWSNFSAFCWPINCTFISIASETVSYPTFSIQHCGSSFEWTLLSLGVKVTFFCLLQDFMGKELEFFMNLCHMDQIFMSYGGEPKDRVPHILCLFVSCP